MFRFSSLKPSEANSGFGGVNRGTAFNFSAYSINKVNEAPISIISMALLIFLSLCGNIW